MGALDNTYLVAKQWEVGFQYRFLHANRFYVGHDYHPERIPTAHHLPIRYTINTLTTRVEYALTDRLTVSLGLPVATGAESREQDDGLRHSQSADGVGDLTFVGSAWLFDPLDHGRGNVRLGFGVKAPTGNDHVNGDFFTATGVERRRVDPAIQLGDGGWGAILQFEAFQALVSRTAVYVAGSYLSNPRVHTNVVIIPPTGGTDFVSVADEYSAHAGLSYAALPTRGLSLSLGGRVDGVPVRDLIGGNDTSFRRPGYVIYAEPAISFTRARSPFSHTGSTFTLSVPIALDQNRKASTYDISHDKHGGGDFARYLVFFGYSRRF